LAPDSVDLLITSPPYLNNYHYNRNTRPHLYWLGFVSQPDDMKPLEERNFGKFWQTVRELERVDLEFSLPDSDLLAQLEKMRGLNTDKGVYGGNGWANYAAAYFNDCHRFAKAMKRALRPGGTALVVIGNSIIQGLLIPTDHYLGKIAESVGLDLVDIHVPRATRVGNSIIQSDVRVGKAKDSHRLYEAVVEIRKT
jgi:DNA modification methylase